MAMSSVTVVTNSLLLGKYKAFYNIFPYFIFEKYRDSYNEIKLPSYL